jgi:putative transposase
MIKSYEVRLLPNQEQEQLLWKHINVSRFIWNFGIAHQEERYKNSEKHLGAYALRKVLIELKQQKEYEWIKEISSHTVSTICLDLESAYKRFFKKQNNRPKFKKKDRCKNSFPARQNKFYFKNNCAVIEKVGKVRYQTNYKLPQGRDVYNFSNPRIKYENDKWILGFGVECEKQTLELTDNSMGIDLGIKKLAVVSCGNEVKVFNNINKTSKVKKLDKRLKHSQRVVSKKYYTNKTYIKSNNIIKGEKRIKQQYNKLSNIRKDYIHQITHKLVELLPYRVVMENLSISNMVKNKYLAKAIKEQCFYEFRHQMQYKCELKGIEFILVDRFYPSSKTCSKCGSIKAKLKFGDRVYKCECCGLEIDRDLNASINLMNYKTTNPNNKD